MEEVLRNIGLSSEEAAIYLSLLTHGPQTAIALSRSTRVKRTYVYKITSSLMAKGLIEKIVEARTTKFIPRSPDHLLVIAESQKHKASQAKLALDTSLSELKDKYAHLDTRPVVTHYEGVEGMKKVFSDIYTSRERVVFGCADLEKQDRAIPHFVAEQIVPQRVQNEIFSKAILEDSPFTRELQKHDPDSLRETLLLDKQQYPLPAEIDVYEDKVALISYANDNFVAIQVQNKDIATSLRSIFKYLFDHKASK